MADAAEMNVALRVLNSGLDFFCPNLTVEERSHAVKDFYKRALPISANRLVTVVADILLAWMFAQMPDKTYLEASGLISALQNLLIRAPMFMLLSVNKYIKSPPKVKTTDADGQEVEVAGTKTDVLAAAHILMLIVGALIATTLRFSSDMLKGIDEPEAPSDLAQTFFNTGMLFCVPFMVAGLGDQQANYGLNAEKYSLFIGVVRRSLFCLAAYDALFHGYVLQKCPADNISVVGIAAGVSAAMEQFLFWANFKFNPWAFKGLKLYTWEEFHPNLLPGTMRAIAKQGLNAGAEMIIDFFANFYTALSMVGLAQLKAAEIVLQMKAVLCIIMIGFGQANMTTVHHQKLVDKDAAKTPENKTKYKEITILNTLASLPFPLMASVVCYCAQNQILNAFLGVNSPEKASVHHNTSVSMSHTITPVPALDLELTRALAEKFITALVILLPFFHIQKMLSSGYKTFENFSLPAIVNFLTLGVVGLGAGTLLTHTLSDTKVPGVSDKSEIMFDLVTASGIMGAIAMALLYYKEIGLGMKQAASAQGISESTSMPLLSDGLTEVNSRAASTPLSRYATFSTISADFDEQRANPSVAITINGDETMSRQHQI